MRFLKIIFSLSTLLLLSSCVTTYAPEGQLPRAEDIPVDAYGAWGTLTVKVSPALSNSDQNIIMGELIAVDDTSVFILNDILLDQVLKKNIEKSIVELDRKHYEYGVHTCLGTVSTISHGILLVVTAPLWILIGIPISAGETNRDRYVADTPDEGYWQSVKNFSRFPQGLPKEINKYLLKPRTIEMNK